MAHPFPLIPLRDGVHAQLASNPPVIHTRGRKTFVEELHRVLDAAKHGKKLDQKQESLSSSCPTVTHFTRKAP